MNDFLDLIEWMNRTRNDLRVFLLLHCTNMDWLEFISFDFAWFIWYYKDTKNDVGNGFEMKVFKGIINYFMFWFIYLMYKMV